MSNILNKYNIYVNTKQRISGTSSSFKIQLNKALLLTNNNTQFQAQISSLEYPYSWFQINSTNNTFVARLHTVSSYTQLTISVTPGNYNINSFLTTLLQNLQNQFLVPALGLVLNYNKSTGKVSMQWTDTTYTGLEMFIENTIVGKVLGFTIDAYPSFSSGIIYSNAFVNVNPINYFLIRSDLVLSNQDMESIMSRSENSDILCKVPVRSPPNTMLYYSQPYDERTFLNIPIIDIISFYVTPNDSKTIIDNNGLDFSFTLTIYEVEKPVHTGYDKFENYIPLAMADNSLVDQRDALIKQLEDAKKNLMDSNVNTGNDAEEKQKS
jgi:hypothetical protein